MSISLETEYYNFIKKHNYQGIRQQKLVLKELDIIKAALEGQTRFFAKKSYIKGLYIYGEVGRGKSFLLDLFFNSLKCKTKQRVNFAHFMQRAHQDINKTKQDYATKAIAKKYAKKFNLLCFDEFFVEDIADAMVLGGLFTELFNQGVTVIATSNIKPTDLYLNGLNRANFLPAIEQIKQHMQIINLNNDADLRLLNKTTHELFYNSNTANFKTVNFNSKNPDIAETEFEFLRAKFELFAKKQNPNPVKLSFSLQGKIKNKVFMGSFYEICGENKGGKHYLELVKVYPFLIIEAIPILDSFKENETRRLISLIDEYYDKRAIVAFSAATTIEELYQGEKLKFAWQRTLSRLHEMQTKNYFNQALADYS